MKDHKARIEKIEELLKQNPRLVEGKEIKAFKEGIHSLVTLMSTEELLEMISLKDNLTEFTAYHERLVNKYIPKQC